MNIKRKPQNSFSVPKNRKARGRRSPEMMTRRQHSQGKDTNEIIEFSSTSTNFTANLVGQEESTTLEITQISDDTEPSMDDDGWLTDTSVEQMRSAGLMNLDETIIPPSLSLKDTDLASLVFLNHGNGPIAYSTPLSLSDDKSFTLSDTDFQVKSFSPVQALPLPCISDDAINESQEKHEDSLAYSKAQSYDYFEISEDSAQCAKQNLNENDESHKSNPFATTVTNKSTNSNSTIRKEENKVENSIEDMDDYSNEDFGEAQDIKIASTKKGKGNRVYKRINGPIRRKHNSKRGNLFKYEGKDDNFTDVKKIQDNELIEDDELDNNQPQAAALQIKSNGNLLIVSDSKRQKDASVLKRSQNFTSLRSEDRNKTGNLSEDMGTLASDDRFENVQIIQNELQDNETKNNHETAIHPRKTNDRITFASILNELTNSNQQEKNGNKIKISPEDVDNYKRIDNFVEAETPKRKGTLQRGISLKFSNREKKLRRRKHKNEKENLFKDINRSDSEDTIENVQHMQNEEQQNDGLYNNQPKTGTHIERKNNNVESNTRQHDASIANISRASSLRRKNKNGEYSLEDIDNSGNKESFKNAQKNPNGWDIVGNSSSLGDNYSKEVSFKEAQNMEIKTSKEKRKLCRGVGIGKKRNGRVCKSPKASRSLSKSQSSTSRGVSKGVQNSPSEDEKTNWPRCCLESPKALLFGQTFRILQPVFREDIPIDSITLVNLGIASKMKCNH